MHLDAVGGFAARRSARAADVDLCLRLGQAGLRTVYTPHARLVHDGCDDDERNAELDANGARFTDGGDPFYNPDVSAEP
jgi:GT2 family glycosyltransferase